MKDPCPICGVDALDQETVDVGVGSIPCGPLTCRNCLAWMEKDGTWIKFTPDLVGPPEGST